ncbi:CarboxypepD_reg-like domain-containing protein [Robiginitalea myxolifaciens]|uniref:CarboxypepD_reg-like domain-containing protein n=1 Tax=Robiginitalea myxolifaciens TaxID=400055 RepID=A0A1I6H543_9FLAO|nr:carboxypeptidase-like regulatory domain-containing protein [Robiginitalea myxolifaciens]SFR49579.1 CarboxypepD_reg-like domain-containing protein [Robiginitalea myxolifaciens]
MKKLLGLCTLFVLANIIPVHSQETSADDFRQFRGEVVDAETGDPLVFATLALTAENISTVTNSDGKFLLKVPNDITTGTLSISFLGYTSKSMALEDLQENNNRIALNVNVLNLPEVDVVVPANATVLVKETLRNRGNVYYDEPLTMTGFYRETIRRRRQNVSLAEAVVNIYKAPYTANRRDAVELYKARKSTDYNKLDTVALKLQGGPYNALFVDIMKYPEYLFAQEYIDDYDFYFERNTRIDDRLIFVIGFKQKPEIEEPLYQGKLFIDGEKRILTSAIFSLNINNEELASRMFVRRKPANAEVTPTEIAYRVDYREKDGRWYYGYSNAMLEFKVDWDKKLFNSIYSLSLEMAITDWELNPEGDIPRYRDRLKSSIILSDEAVGFSDPDFWGAYNIIEPDKSIESAIRKIQRQLRREQRREQAR